MQICTFMTFNTVHTPFAEMHVARNTFVLADVLIAHAAAMTGSAGASHGWCHFEYMPGKQTATDIFRLAYMTFAAGGMTGRAMIAEHLLQGRVILRYTARIKGSPVALLSGMQCERIGCCLF